MVRVLGIDPGLQRTGWGVIDLNDNHMRHVANGVVSSTQSLSLAERLVQLFSGLTDIINEWSPDEAAVEETFVNKNPVSTLKLGQARGAALLAPARLGIPVTEYTPNAVKKTVVGAGHAAKQQVEMMVSTLLPGCKIAGPDAADALAVAICHAQHAGTRQMMNRYHNQNGGSAR
ncbi:crossover junction endodeoxyribonuclease RuvC [Thalassospira marina]|uniref:crossover junction endodeoxyribonuclease RuvC n=1 Tax=Thalassospira marina TaxID=2048283 RepID=UPI001FE67315|nr:crossover junction endodeoxyribonuclease RuvC [Thalassospira marina]